MLRDERDVMASIPIWLVPRVTPRPNKPFLSSISKGDFSCLAPLGTCRDDGLMFTESPGSPNVAEDMVGESSGAGSSGAEEGGSSGAEEGGSSGADKGGSSGADKGGSSGADEGGSSGADEGGSSERGGSGADEGGADKGSVRGTNVSGRFEVGSSGSPSMRISGGKLVGGSGMPPG